MLPFRLEAPCPKNYNPADYFIQLLAIIPEQEESCRQAVNLICSKYERSEFGAKMILESSTKVKFYRYEKYVFNDIHYLYQ